MRILESRLNPTFPSPSESEPEVSPAFYGFTDEPSNEPLVTYTYEGEAIPDQAKDLVELTDMVGVTDYG